jgi:prolyl-tRNA editing enzyme YbaK/EbsC (Cys-tRNA(Pro) deacylase)
MKEDLLGRPAVKRVVECLVAAGSSAEVIVLSDTARTAQDAASSLDCELGAIVKSLVFAIGGQPVMALVAGDRQCDIKALPAALGMAGKAKRADADVVREITGFSIGGVAPVGHLNDIPLVIDQSLERFEVVYAAAGHPHCVFATSSSELSTLTGANISTLIAQEP